MERGYYLDQGPGRCELACACFIGSMNNHVGNGSACLKHSDRHCPPLILN